MNDITIHSNNFFVFRAYLYNVRISYYNNKGSVMFRCFFIFIVMMTMTFAFLSFLPTVYRLSSCSYFIGCALSPLFRGCVVVRVSLPLLVASCLTCRTVAQTLLFVPSVFSSFTLFVLFFMTIMKYLSLPSFPHSKMGT